MSGRSINVILKRLNHNGLEKIYINVINTQQQLYNIKLNKTYLFSHY